MIKKNYPIGEINKHLSPLGGGTPVKVPLALKP